MAPPAQQAGRRPGRWSRESIIEKIVAWERLYSEPPSSADWNPSLARWRAQEWRIERYRQGEWPSTNAVKRHFGESFDAAVRAAGFEPRRPGPRPRPAHSARPAIAQREPQTPRSVDEELLAAAELVHAAEARARAAEKRAAAAERRIERVEERLDDARARARKAGARARRAEASRDRARSGSLELRESVEDELRDAIIAADDRARDAEGLLVAVRDQAIATEHALEETRAALAAERTARRRAEATAIAAAAPNRNGNGNGNGDRTVDGDAIAALAAEHRTAERANARRAGAPVPLERHELTALRRAGGSGPSGPAVLARALRALASARGRGDRDGVDRALAELAAAAVRWRDRL